MEEILDVGITLAHCPGDLSSVSLAQGAMMFILMLAHGYGFASSQFFQGKFFSFQGMEVVGRSLGILGFGGGLGVPKALPFGTFFLKKCIPEQIPKEACFLRARWRTPRAPLFPCGKRRLGLFGHVGLSRQRQSGWRGVSNALRAYPPPCLTLRKGIWMW